MRQHNKNPVAEFHETALASAEPSTEIYIDDDWLEALLENLALAQLSKSQCVALIDQLEEIERNEPVLTTAALSFSSDFGRTLLSAYRPAAARVVVGGTFTAEFNEYAMRSPASMSHDNVCESIERAVRQLQALGQTAAVRQIVFFISSNMDEVIAEADDE